MVIMTMNLPKGEPTGRHVWLGMSTGRASLPPRNYLLAPANLFDKFLLSSFVTDVPQNV